MKIYKKGKDFATFQVDESWVETEDEIVETIIGTKLKSQTKTKEFEEHVVREQKIKEIQNLKLQIIKFKEDVEQAMLFGMERDDLLEKKEKCKNIVLELKKLENELKN